MVTKQDIQNAIATLDQDVQDEIARFTKSLTDSINANKLPDGSVVLSADEAQSVLDSISKIDTNAKSADQ